MTAINKWIALAGLITCAAVAAIHATDSQTSSDGEAAAKTERARVALSHALPVLDGRHLKTTIIEVTYGPGQSSPPHSHPCPVIGYVLEGTLRTQVKGDPEAIYKAGESFYEAPNGVHQVSANASQMEPAKFIAFFVCDREGPLSIEAPISQPTAGR
jgi:quercetin dioxygenase-like cupin family protein